MSIRRIFLPGIIATIAVATTSACLRASDANSTPWRFSADTNAPGSNKTVTPFQPGTADPDHVFETPTPDAPGLLPTLRIEEDSYIVQPGDTLLIISLKFGVPAQQIIIANNLTNPDLLEVGQLLIIPAPDPLPPGPDFKIIPDSELVFGPAAADFDLPAFILMHDGYLAHYEEEVNGTILSGIEILNRVALDYSINPRLLLAVLDHQSGWISESNPAEQKYPLGLLDPMRANLYRQLAWAADNLNRGYYSWRVTQLSAYILADGGLVPPDPTINAGTAGVQFLYSQLYGFDNWHKVIGETGLITTFEKLFGYPFKYTIDPIVPVNLIQPAMQLPFEPEDIWNFTGGPHGGWDDGSGWAALDFAPPGDALGCVSSDRWVVAVADGMIIRANDGRVIQDLDGDQNEHTGWVIFYMHVEDRDRVEPGVFLQAGDRIGYPSCEGGISSGTHLHIARKYNGEWIPADQDFLPFIMDGWRSTGVGYYYDGWLVKGNQSVIADNGRIEENEISR